jgi:hypothetical protein
MDSDCRPAGCRHLSILQGAYVHDGASRELCWRLSAPSPGRPRCYSLICRHQQSRPKVLSRLVFDMVAHFLRHVHHPIRQCQIALHQINLVISTHLRGNRILLRQNQSHYLAELDMVEGGTERWSWKVVEGEWMGGRIVDL